MKLKLIKTKDFHSKIIGERLRKEIKRENLIYNEYIEFFIEREILYTKKELYINDINNKLLELKDEYLYLNKFAMNNFRI